LQGAKVRTTRGRVNIGKTPGRYSTSLVRALRAVDEKAAESRNFFARAARASSRANAHRANVLLGRARIGTLARAMLDATVDHVAIAVRDMRAAIGFYTNTLGASFVFAGDMPEQGFRWAQFGFPGGGKFELVTPIGDGFVARFLERRGEGVHHVTLKVPDIAAAIDGLTADGVPLFNVNIGGPYWREAFIHPRDANGTLIQVAWSPFSDEETARHHLLPHESDDHRHLTLADLTA
jgi:methylmalonyl-CoA/ethylmalonyl-CoA epimerase